MKLFFISLGVCAFVFITLSFTSLPYKAYRNLGEIESSFAGCPQAIIFYSAAGMPDPNTLMRLYSTALYAKKYPNSKIFIAYPIKNSYDSLSVELLCNELITKGINKNRFFFEPNGTNTFEQTSNIYIDLQEKNINSIKVISSPEHVFRAVACFKKLGLKNISSTAAVEQVISPESLQTKSDESMQVNSLHLRYNIWNYMKYEITVLREYIAIAYYKFKGWI